MNPNILVKPSFALMSRLSKVVWVKGLTKMSEFFVGDADAFLSRCRDAHELSR